MANTTTFDGNFITIVPDGSTDWTTSGTYASGNGVGITWLKVRSIQFSPSAGSDALVVHDGGIDATEVFNVSCQNANDQKVRYYWGQWMRPVIDVTDCTFGTPASCKILIEIE